MRKEFATERASALQLDRSDYLAHFRERFHMIDDSIYVDGNSLGLLSKDAESSLLRVVNEWKRMGIAGWLEAERPWFYAAERLGADLCGIIGAAPDEVVAAGGTTVNLHALVSTFYRPRGRRTKILADEITFPSDVYALRAQVRLRGLDPASHLVLVPGEGGRFLDESRIEEMMSEEVAVAVFPSVLYRSGQLLDMARLTRAAHERGIVIGFDCSHSVGVVPHSFDSWDVDFACWCAYKYLNGGPGCPGFIYVNRRHFDLGPGLAGWFGYVKDRQFDMRLEFEHARCAGGWQISSAPILGSAPLEGSLKIINEAGIDAIREKSQRMTSYLMFLVDEILSGEPYRIRIGTPREVARRGGHVALEPPRNTYGIFKALKARRVIGDFRPPNVIRICPSPLYNTYEEIWQAVRQIKEIIDEREYERFDSPA